MSAPTSPQDLIQELLLLPHDAQQHYLAEHAPLLDDELAAYLKQEADRLLRVDVSQSLQTAELLYRVAEHNDEQCHRALGLLVEANARSIGGLGEYQRAVELYDEAAAIYERHDRPIDQARSQIGKLWSLASLGRYDEALQSGQWARRVFEEHEAWESLAVLTMNMAAVNGRRGDDEQALLLFDQAGELYRQLGAAGEQQLPWVEDNRAIVLRNLGRFEESIEGSRRAQRLLGQFGQEVEAARAQQNLAITYFVIGRYNEALELLDSAGGVFRADGRSRDTILVELFMSDCLLQLRRFGDVLQKCNLVRAQFNELGTRFELAQAILNQAVAYAGLRKYDEALTALADARSIFEAENNVVWVAATDLERAAVLLHTGAHADCISIANECAESFQARSMPLPEAHANLLAARAALHIGDLDSARRGVAAAQSNEAVHDLPSVSFQIQHLEGLLRRATGDLEAALTHFARAVDELDRLRGRLMVEFRIDFVEDKLAVYEEAVDVCLELQDAQQALAYVERAKSRALHDSLAYRLDLRIRPRQERDAERIERLNDLRAKRDRLYRRWESRDLAKEEGWQVPGAEQEVRTELLRLENQITDLWHRLLVRNADYARDAMVWQRRDESLQSYLDDDTLVLEYFISRGALLVFLISANSVTVQPLAAEMGQIQRLLQRLQLNFNAVAKGTPAQANALEENARLILGRLHGLLLGALQANIGKYSRIVIAPHGPLHYVPFHALHDGQVYLLEQHEVSYLPGSSFLRFAGQRQLAPGRAIVVGHSQSGRLPHALEEARAVADCLGGELLLESDATLKRFRDNVADCRTVHLAAHGEFRADNPLFSGLNLADGWLTTLDIFNLQLNASLVTLSACETGRNVVAGGDELLGLMRAFLQAGASTLLLSQWAVEDRSTAKLMETFYTLLAQNESKGGSLRETQRMFINGTLVTNGGPSYSHPYYWAPFYLVGETSRL